MIERVDDKEIPEQTIVEENEDLEESKMIIEVDDMESPEKEEKTLLNDSNINTAENKLDRSMNSGQQYKRLLTDN